MFLTVHEVATDKQNYTLCSVTHGSPTRLLIFNMHKNVAEDSRRDGKKKVDNGSSSHAVQVNGRGRPQQNR